MEVDTEVNSAPAEAAEPAQPTESATPAEPTRPVEPTPTVEQVKLAETAEAASPPTPAAPTTAQVTQKLRDLTLNPLLQQKPAKPVTASSAAPAQPRTRATPRTASPAPSAVSTHSHKRSRTASERSATSSDFVEISDDDERPAKKRPTPNKELTREERWNAHAVRENENPYHPRTHLPPRDPNGPEFPYRNHTGFDKKVSVESRSQVLTGPFQPRKINPTFLDRLSTWISGIKMAPADYSPSDISGGYLELARQAVSSLKNLVVFKNHWFSSPTSSHSTPKSGYRSPRRAN
jgi:hypothetical protein